MSTMVHVADLSHPAKPWELHIRWSEGIMDEFFKQGDMEAELGLPISPLCDRVATNVPESQIGFLDVIVKPVFTLLFEEVEELIVPFLHKVASKELCQKSTGASGVKKSQSGNNSMGEGGPCAGAKILSSLDISAFKTTVMHNIQANRNKWKEALEAKRKEEESNKAKESNNSKESPGKESNKAKGNKTKESPDKESNKAKGNNKTKELPGNESNNAHNHEDKAHNKKTQKRTSSNTALSKSKKYCVVPQAPSTCDCQLCDSRAFEPMNLNFIVFNTGLPEMFLPRQDSEAMEVTESYEELADKESSWRKAAGQTVESNIQEMRAMVPKTKPLSPNESDDVIIEEFVPDDPQSQMALTSGPPAISGQECPQQPPNVGFIMTDLSKSDMEIFSLWNEEVLRRAAEQQKQDHLPAPDDAPLQVAVSAKQQMECQGYEGASAGKPPETFVLQVISFDSPSMTFSKDATLNCNPGLQALPSPTADGSVVPVNTSQQSQTDSCDAAAVSITSLNYGVFQLPQ
ncbi:uncharacterized protein LOC132585868 [Heteronotia binoei]|uniref:uncharacterized protein LOC132585868 n=1 Tax=Heteronotia binoei TaxID=13085 RepID=UPI00292CC960|nr:uncharacterized protein LOC132585868 [Heteronotia binoei]